MMDTPLQQARYQWHLAAVALLLGICLGTTFTASFSRQPAGEVLRQANLCDEHRQRSIVVIPGDGERQRGRLDVATIESAANIFRACGLVAISAAVSRSEVDDFAHHADLVMAPLLESRARVRSSKKTRVQDFHDEPFLSAGEAIRERQDGRLDLLLPHTLPFNASAFTINPLALGLIRDIFSHSNGGSFELKSVHAVTALPGTRAQQWHRDDEPIFQDPGATGVYALNAFVALSDVGLTSGPTEYLLGSHTVPDGQIQELLAAPHVAAAAFAWPKGSIVLMDYRTVHRGGANNKHPASPRTLAMLVYGRSWWRDAVNYMGDNYGGASRLPPASVVQSAGGGPEGTLAAVVVARRIAQRLVASKPHQEADRAAMLARCRALWDGDDSSGEKGSSHATGSPERRRGGTTANAVPLEL